MQDAAAHAKFKPYTRQSIKQAPQWERLHRDQREAVDVVSRILPFRVNAYVLDHLIDWDRVPDDPIYRLTFPHRDMLPDNEYLDMHRMISGGAPEAQIDEFVRSIRMRMNPHPAGQMTHNVPTLDGVALRGLQHKYRETVLFFPGAGQTCHAYCTFCFRWPQFVGMEELKFDAKESQELCAYLRRHPEVTDVLVTGGDPMVMNARSLAEYLDPLLAPELAHVQSIRIGTKSVAYWPQRYVTDKDADDLLRLFERVVGAGRNLALMAHYSHPRELEQPVAQQAVRRIIATGATVRIQAPLIRHVNEDAACWSELWTTGVKLGATPYYMFVERDTGPSSYFKLPLVKAYQVFQQAYRSVSGLARTVRGPSMSAFPGKVMVDGIVELGGEKLLALQFLQARNPLWVRRPFYAKYDAQASWLDELRPAFGERFFFEADQPAAPSSLLQPIAIHPSRTSPGPATERPPC
ncbi:KamA family radical SAM protein [Pseudorhodoferax soli]|uniref:KamA family protein n=1 Tax=Pseudorhodoferax soli TaxID=545864 RepID=A0A368XF76_9BURK|nr:lysine 2,3-aminomutase [Pseudorhodoferax soli]RCW65147.1 KamA family protein [Pseudorhodoferax soli]